ncbi:hypothetical protein HPB51_023426 [Rhipicephalus microplus]|uniref:Tick transposon n=1 Tax=Rhipicephalus microplus TaxID=6941 RepID=A0A9J6DK27_RHIMP|nr:hypothetical protein HPB51_023426 [Rhipicephalus microplus]
MSTCHHLAQQPQHKVSAGRGALRSTANYQPTDQVLASGVLLTSGRSRRLSWYFSVTAPEPSYDTLKAAIISCKFESEHSKLLQLIMATELGDRRPSQLLRRMHKLYGGPSAPQQQELLHELFLQRLPKSMVAILADAGDVPVDTLAEMADRVADYLRAHSLSAVTTPLPATAADPALASIENRLDALVRRLDDFVRAHRQLSSRFQIQSPSSTAPSSPDLQPTNAPRDVSSSTVCWYHRRYDASPQGHRGHSCSEHAIPIPRAPVAATIDGDIPHTWRTMVWYITSALRIPTYGRPTL